MSEAELRRALVQKNQQIIALEEEVRKLRTLVNECIYPECDNCGCRCGNCEC